MSKFKWNDELSRKAVDAYEASDKDVNAVDTIAEDLGTTRKSVIGKLVSEKVYVKQEKPARQTPVDEGPTKKEIIAALATAGMDVEALKPESANKAFLQYVADLMNARVGDVESVNVGE